MNKLKHFFIPHEGNGYKPHSIRPKHLLAHASFAVFLKIFLIAFIFTSPLSALLAPDVLAQQGQKIIALTNNARQAMGVAPLRVSPVLNSAAQNKSDNMAELRYFAHTGPDGKKLADWLRLSGYGFAVAGENLAVGYSTPEGVISGWTKSKTHYANMIDPDFSEVGVGLSAGTYKDKDSLFVAQYLASPNVYQAVTLAAKPTIDSEKSVLTARKTADGIKLKAAAYISPDAVKADVFLGDKKIALQKSASQSGLWTGETTISNFEKKTGEPLVLAAVAAKDSAGNASMQDIALENFKPLEPTPVDHYFFLKANPAIGLQTLFDVSSIYYSALIILMIGALILNIFIERKKQHPHLIYSAAGLVLFSLILLKF